MGRWRLLACGVAVTVLAAACGGRGASRPAAQPPARARVALAVEERTEAFVDATRPTDPSDAAPASAVRALPTRIFFPGAGQPGRPYPLVVFAHGSGGLGADYDVLLRTWAAAGYVVAAPTFPFAASREATAAEAVIDYPNLPVDMSFVVDQTLRLNGDAGSALHGAVDPARVGAAGHSLGGMVTLALAGNTCCHDPRVKAAVVLAGREVPFGSGQFWARIATPILFVHGDADTNVAYADGRRAFGDAPPPRFLLTVLGGDHGRPYSAERGDPQASLVTDVVLDFLDHYLKGGADGLARLQTRASAPGVATLEQER